MMDALAKKLIGVLCLFLIVHVSSCSTTTTEDVAAKSVANVAKKQVVAAEDDLFYPLPESIERWQDMRFGMFIHWSIASLRGEIIGWSRGSTIPIAEYDELPKEFNPVKFNADEWVQNAVDMGAQYIVFTAKHHDGFCFWDTKYTDYNIMNTPFGRDVVKELSEACQKKGIAFGAYYSVSDFTAPLNPVTNPRSKEPASKPQGDIARYTREYMNPQLTELLNNYGPVYTIWFDYPKFMTRELGEETIKHIRSQQRGALVNKRIPSRRGMPPGDYDTPEQKIGSFNNVRPWESCVTLTKRWSWTTNDYKNNKSLDWCIRTLVSTASGNGNFLFNVGPNKDGQMEPHHVARLKEVGQWLKKYGESIYKTRGGPFVNGDWGGSTHRGQTIYVHVLQWPKKGNLQLPSISEKIVASSVLTGGDVTVTQNRKGVTISVAKEHRDAIDTIIVLKTDRPVTVPPIQIKGIKKHVKHNSIIVSEEMKKEREAKQKEQKAKQKTQKSQEKKQVKKPPFEPTWESLEKLRGAPEWLQDAKFGIYTHWGPQTRMCEDLDVDLRWLYPTDMYMPERPIFEYHKRVYGDQHTVGYKDVIDLFRPVNFDPDNMAEMFYNAGARFGGMVMMHRDNVALWDSEVTPWNVMKLGPKRDIGGELATAYRKKGMHFLASFHHLGVWAQEFKNVYDYDAKNGDYTLLYNEKHDPKDPPSERYLQFMLDTIDEVVRKYEPDFLYFDYGLGMSIPEEYQKRIIASYYNRSAAKGKEVTITHKHGDKMPTGMRDFERGRPVDLRAEPFTNDTSVAPNFWYYNKRRRSQRDLFTSQYLIQVLIDVASKNGIFILNIMPDKLGDVPEDQQQILTEMGQWLSIYGEAIYKTRPWKTYGEGPYRMRYTGYLPERSAMERHYCTRDIRFTISKDQKTLYAIFMDKPVDGLEIRSMLVKDPEQLKFARWVGHGPVKIEVNENRHPVVRIDSAAHIDESSKKAYAIAFPASMVTYNKAIEDEQFEEMVCQADTADIQGDTASLTNEEDDVETRLIGSWTNPNDTISWNVDIPKPGKWLIEGLINCRKTALTVSLGDLKKKVKVSPTRRRQKGNKDLGVFDIPAAGKYRLTLRPNEQEWSPIDVYSVKIRRVE